MATLDDLRSALVAAKDAYRRKPTDKTRAAKHVAAQALSEARAFERMERGL